MKLHLPSPVESTALITQRFGENPQNYERFGLRGHNGIDYALASGSPIFAVDDGEAIELLNDEAGYGLYIKLRHAWGESLYAHLRKQLVTVGAKVERGQKIGESGNTGNSTGPHLHFGMRINPCVRSDGWSGYVDPYPYLHTAPPKGIIGPHIIGGLTRHLSLLRYWQPRLILVLDPNPEEMRALREACPGTTIVGRVYAPDSEVDDRIRKNPEEAAAWAHSKVMERMTPYVDYWQIANEVLQDWASLPLLSRFEVARMDQANAAGYKCGILGFGVGNPDMPEHDRLALWRQVDPALAKAETEKHVVVLHQYGKPDLWKPDADWFIHRLEHNVLPLLPYRRLRFAVTEYGIDGLIWSTDGKPSGWKNFTNALDYVDQLTKIGRFRGRFRGQVIGYAVFTLGHNPPWQTYDIDGEVAQRLSDHYSVAGETTTPVTPVKPTTPTTPTAPAATPRLSDGAKKLNIEIRNLGQGDFRLVDVFTTVDGSWEPGSDPYSLPQWARDKYLKPAGASDYFDDAGGDHNLFVRVLDEQGNAIGTDALFWSEENSQLEPTNAVVRRTDEKRSGWANLPIWSSHAPDRGGRGAWRFAPKGASQVVVGGGLPLNRHVSLFAVWQRGAAAPVEPTPTKPTEPATGGAVTITKDTRIELGPGATLTIQLDHGTVVIRNG